MKNQYINRDGYRTWTIKPALVRGKEVLLITATYTQNNAGGFRAWAETNGGLWLTSAKQWMFAASKFDAVVAALNATQIVQEVA